MLIEWKFCFRDSTATEVLLHALVQEREGGHFMGSTFPAARSHTCFSEEHCLALRSFLKQYPEVVYQYRSYYRGNLFDSDFGLDTFDVPLVQWCPSPIYSVEFGQSIPPEEPWGLTMEGLILLDAEWKETADRNVVGLQRDLCDVGAGMDAYRLQYECVGLNYVVEEGKPLMVECVHVPEVDILSLDNGIILCSSRFATMLRRDWDGMVHAKFQPVRCCNVPDWLGQRNLEAIPSRAGRAAGRVEHDIRLLEKVFATQFPAEYVAWVAGAGRQLPLGWLSPVGGVNSELAKYAKQEYDEAQPSMPRQLVPLYAYGSGDSVCLDKETLSLVEWNHASGKFTQIEMRRGFAHFVEQLSRGTPGRRNGNAASS